MTDEIKNDLTNISPYDQSYPAILLDEAFAFQLDKANRVATDIYDEVVKKTSPSIPTIQNNEKTRLVVDLSDDQMQDIQDGKIKLVEENHQLYAQLKENGLYSKKLPIKEETFDDQLSAIQAANALQFKAIQESLDKISEQLKNIDESVRSIENGQQTDRIGLYYSGIALYIEASSITNPSLREMIMSQALKSLTESSFQLTLIMQEDIRYLRNKEYASQKKVRAKLINEKMISINQCFSIIHQSSVMRAGIYCQLGEFEAMGSVLAEYSRFISGTVAENASLLSQCDVYDDGTLTGTWKSRANLVLDTSNITKQLQAPKEPIYIEIKKEIKSNESI